MSNNILETAKRALELEKEPYWYKWADEIDAEQMKFVGTALTELANEVIKLTEYKEMATARLGPAGWQLLEELYQLRKEAAEYRNKYGSRKDDEFPGTVWRD